MPVTRPFQAAGATLAVVAVAALSAQVPAGRAVASNAKQALLQGVPREAVSLDFPEAETTDMKWATRARGAYVPGHVVVRLDGGVSPRTLQSMARDVGASRIVRADDTDFYYVDLPDDVDVAEAAATLASQPGVLTAEPDAAMYPSFRPNDQFYNLQWHLQKIGMETAWDINPGAESAVKVAVVDTGVAFLNMGNFARAPELASTSFESPYDFIWDDAEPVDMDGHGTHVTGTIAQNTNNGSGVAGMAFNVSIIPVKALCTDWDFTFGAPAPTGCGGLTVSRGVRWAVDRGAKVINLSLGGPAPSTPLRDSLVYAVERGAIVLIAAGNDGDRGNPVEYPAAYSDISGVMTVAALDFNLNKAYYSGFKDYVEIAAPGGDIRFDLNSDTFADGVLQQTLSAAPQASGIFNVFAFRFFQGTSMATPHVAGLAALLVDQGITSPRAIEAAIKRFARDIDAAGIDPQTGHGLIQPRETLRGLGILR